MRRPQLACLMVALGMLTFARAQDGGTPPEVASNVNQWPLPNGDYSSTRAARGSTISSANVHRLQVAWSRGITRTATAPLVLDDTVYFQDLLHNVFAIDLSRGDVQWVHRFNTTLYPGPNGVAVGWGKVFAPHTRTLSASILSALDIHTGEEIWSVNVSGTGTFIGPQPIVHGGLVYFGTTSNGYAPGTVGAVHALDQATGEKRWSFQTVEEGLWGNPQVNAGGGVWYPPSIDPERGIVFAGVGNPGPWPGTGQFPNGTSRPGPNLYTCSVVALDHDTGELKWFNQVKPHDLFDHDFQLSPILATVRIGGEDRDIVIGGGKTGTIHAFDRETGDELWKTPVGVHQNDDLTELPPGETIVFPGALGGVLTPMAYAGGIVYAPVINKGNFFSPTSRSGLNEETGELTAIAADTGEELWSHEFDFMVAGSATVVNDLVFTSTVDGRIYALDRESGTEKWQYRAPPGIQAWPAVAGDTIVLPANSKLIAFRLLPEGDPLRGGRLYDRWWTVNGAEVPAGDHPLYPEVAETSGSTTFRCKECHGWDYKGADGVYATGPHFTGIDGILGSTRMPFLEIFDMIKNPPGDGTEGTSVNGHGFGNSGVSDADLWDLVQFLMAELVDTDDFIDPQRKFNGDAAQGELNYLTGGCGDCHGPDGTWINFASPEEPEWLGTIAVVNPWELMHKIRFGQPEAPFMPSWLELGGSTQGAADIGRYIQDNFPTGLEAVGPYVRGDCDGDGTPCSGVNDALELLSWLFLGRSEPPCLAACDPDGNGELELADAVYGLNFCFKGSDAPVEPFPACGVGTDADQALGCEISACE